jgi:hypothetical protein
VLHPIRLRIIESFLGDRQRTTSELRAELSDVPAASLYRHVARLVEGDVLVVVAERRVRGALERTYALGRPRQMSSEELAAMTPEDHRRAFLAYVAGMLADFDRYIGTGEVDMARDGVGYRMFAMWLTDDEFVAFATDLGQVVIPRVANRPGGGRSRRIVRTVFLPDPGAVPDVPPPD